MTESTPTGSSDAMHALEFAVTPSQLMLTLEHVLSSRAPDGSVKEQGNVMVWGPMGIGKTDVCRSVGKLWGRRIVALHLPQFDPTDLKGIPVRLDDGSVVWVPSSYLPQMHEEKFRENTKDFAYEWKWEAAEQIMVHVFDASGKTVAIENDGMNPDFNDTDLKIVIDHEAHKVHVLGEIPKGTRIWVIDKAIIFLDELSAAVPAVQNAALQLVLDKRVGEYDVPPFTPVIGAGNRESDQAFVSPMSMPLANRFMHCRLVESLEDWMEWAMINRVDPSILGYLQWRKDHLFHFRPENMAEGDYGFPTPRSWAKLSEQMAGLHALPDPVQAAVVTGFVGRTIGQQFLAHREMADLLPKTDDILQGKPVEIADDLNVGAKYALATALCYAVADYHAKHYDASVSSTDGIEKQPKEWQVAAKSFCEFIDTYLGSEMTVLCVYIVSKHLEVPFTRFRGTDFIGFASQYRDILRKAT